MCVCVCVCVFVCVQISFIHSPIDEYLPCFHVLLYLVYFIYFEPPPAKAYPEGISSLPADPHTEQLREQPPGLSDVSASRMSHEEPSGCGHLKT